jgi:hypothetical protein
MRAKTYRGLEDVTDYSQPEPGHWISKCCGAHCAPRDTTCWNCGRKRDRARAAKVVPTVCDFEDCGTQYHYLVGSGGEEIGQCPFHFLHYGWNAYYPPNFRPDLLWDLDGYEFDDDAYTITKLERMERDGET